MSERRFAQLDVFASGSFSGNPLACVIDAEGMTTEEMQRFTRWTNLSEASFLLEPTTPEADYRVRIFTAPRELPFAGHPTIGSCQAWLDAGGVPKTPGRVVQECGAGLIEIKLDEPSISFAAPPLLRAGNVDESYIVELAELLGLARTEIVDAQWGDNGPGWVIILLKDADAVLNLSRPVGPCPHLDVGVVGPYPEGSEYAVEVRAFFADDSGAIGEDPVTGSLNASVAQWLLASGRVKAPYVASQGTAMGRAGRVLVSQDPDGKIWVGGIATNSITGTISLT